MIERLRTVLPAATAARWRALADAAPAGPLKLERLLDPAAALAAIAPLRPRLQSRLGPALCCNVDQCWLRRADPAHHWHQDGALHEDFAGRPSGELLPMLTLWIALTPCGETAPGLEWAEPTPRRMLAPAELSDDAVAALAPRRRHALLDAGDALLFDGALLHRTQPMPGASARRASVELRFFADPPPRRVAHERMLGVG